MSRQDYLALLRDQPLEALAAPHTSHGVNLAEPVDVDALPGFDHAIVSVQDAASQLAVPLLELSGGLRILDACSAPGGKTGHILEQEWEYDCVVCVEQDPQRVARLEENMRRLGFTPTVFNADVTSTKDWWDGKPFDRILLDAPCSATGVIRRHPDIKSRRRRDDLPELASQQSRLLETVWGLLAPGGMLLYATCSVLPQENQRQIERLLAMHDDAFERPLEASWGEPTRPGRQIIPGESGMDGFYYAVVEKH